GRMLFTALLQRHLELTQYLLLLFGQANRRLDGHVAVEIARIARPQAADALATQPEGLAGLSAFGNRDGAAPGQRGDLKLATQCRGGEGDRELAMQVVAVTLEDA